MKQKKNRNNRHDYYKFDCDETFEVMVKGTEVSKKITEVIVGAGKGRLALGSVVYGMAKATVLLEELALREGYDFTPMYQEIRRYWKEYCKGDEFDAIISEVLDGNPIYREN